MYYRSKSCHLGALQDGIGIAPSIGENVWQDKDAGMYRVLSRANGGRDRMNVKDGVSRTQRNYDRRM